MLFFVLPIEVRWLALIAWIGYGWRFLSSPLWIERLHIFASVANFLLFFGPALIARWRGRQRRWQHQRQQAEAAKVPRNVCAVCGRSNVSDPQLEFRYCSQCGDGSCYCQEHLADHEHRT